MPLETPGPLLTLNASKTLIDTRTIGQSPEVIGDECNLVANRYRFKRPLGEGGMGNVYLADDLLLTRQVAVKTIRPELSDNEEVRARIKHECRLHAAIGVHPHIITLYDTVEENGHIYLVMEYFEGETLAGRLATATSSGMPLDQALDIIRQLLQALSCIHGRDIVHRDIKTSNILLQLQADGRYLAKLTDFWIARAETEASDLTRLTSLGTQGPGTPMYMAPERIDPQTFGDICPATDLYAVGIILYELLTGGPPFKGSMTEIFSGHLVQQPALDALPPTLPAGLDAVLHQALAKQPADRYQDAASFLAALAMVGEGAPSLPLFAAVQEATLLAMDSEEALPVGCEATLLDPALGQGKGLSPRKRQWWYLAAVLAVLLAGYFLRNHLTTAHDGGLMPPSGTAPEVAPAAPAKPSGEPKEEPTSALQAVETVRQPKSAEALTPPDRKATPAPGGQEWQVIENNSRKIR